MYDNLGRRQSIEVQDAAGASFKTSYGYDGFSRMKQVINGQLGATYGYLPGSSLIQQLTVASNGSAGLVTSRAYDALDRLTDLWHIRSSDAASMASNHFTYNLANQRTTAIVGATATIDAGSWAYGNAQRRQTARFTTQQV